MYPFDTEKVEYSKDGEIGIPLDNPLILSLTKALLNQNHLLESEPPKNYQRCSKRRKSS